METARPTEVPARLTAQPARPHAPPARRPRRRWSAASPLTQTRLARQIGLTTPATSALLNRLEDAGHVERHRSRADRRVVTLRATQAMHDEVHRYFRAVGDELDSVASAQSDETLERFTTMITGMTAVMDRRSQA